MICLRWQIQDWVFFSRIALKINLTHIDLRTKTHNKSKITYIIGCVDNCCTFYLSFIDAGIFYGAATYFHEFILLLVYQKWSKYTRVSAFNKVNVTYMNITLK